jgi:hypothetical protein
MGKGADKKAVLSVLVVMIALATVDVVRAISDTDIKYGSYTQATAYVQGSYTDNKIYNGYGYIKGYITNDLPTNNILAISWFFDCIVDGVYYSVGNDYYYPGYSSAGQNTKKEATYATASFIGSGKKVGYGVLGSPPHWDTAEAYASIPYN